MALGSCVGHAKRVESCAWRGHALRTFLSFHALRNQKTSHWNNLPEGRDIDGQSAQREWDQSWVWVGKKLGQQRPSGGRDSVYAPHGPTQDASALWLSAAFDPSCFHDAQVTVTLTSMPPNSQWPATLQANLEGCSREAFA